MNERVPVLREGVRVVGIIGAYHNNGEEKGSEVFCRLSA